LSAGGIDVFTCTMSFFNKTKLRLTDEKLPYLKLLNVMFSFYFFSVLSKINRYFDLALIISVG
jgi:hypothetical protein